MDDLKKGVDRMVNPDAPSYNPAKGKFPDPPPQPKPPQQPAPPPKIEVDVKINQG